MDKDFLQMLLDNFSSQKENLKNMDINTIEKGEFIREAYLLDLNSITMILEEMIENGVQ